VLEKYSSSVAKVIMALAHGKITKLACSISQLKNKINHQELPQILAGHIYANQSEYTQLHNLLERSWK
jgi:hypothetical protein